MPVIDLGSVVGPQGPQGATGATGAQGIQGNPGPNQVTDQTSTNLNGVLFGNQSRVTVKPVDSTPTADSTNLVSSGGTDKAIKGRVPVNGMGKNLLDNWYFGNPVNQRGQSSYSTDGAYTIDRWKLGGVAGTASFDSSGVLMSNHTLIGNWFEVSRVISGATYTISALWSNGLITATGTLTIGSGISGWQISYGSPTTPRTISIRQFNASIFQFVLVGDGTSKAIAAKVELGTEQTLCHNEGTAENPVWVLNEIPDYGEELRKCQRYYVAIKPRAGGTPLIGVGMVVASTQAAVTIPLPVTLRGATVIPEKSGTVKLWHGSTIGSSAVDVSGFVGSAVSDNSVTVTVSVSGGLNIGEVCALQFRSDDAALSFSCEL